MKQGRPVKPISPASEYHVYRISARDIMNFLFGRGQKFYHFATKLAELMWLNFLVFLCSIPVLTIGAATSAMHHVLIQIYRDEEQKITRTFFSAFKKNFGQATLVWLIYLAF